MPGSLDWVNLVLAKPWEAGARGPDTFDCYGLLWWVSKNFYGVDLPCLQGGEFTFSATPNFQEVKRLTDVFQTQLRQRTPLKAPVDGCAVGLSRIGGKVHHCGIWVDLDGGLVIHAEEATHVRAQTVRDMRFRGWSIIEFYTYKEKLPFP